MNKKILLGAAISLASLQVTAQPFAPTDARGMAMGGTGVASAKTVHAVQYNPSLLSGGDESDDFGLLLPQLGGYVADEDEFIDSADEFSDANYDVAFTNAFNGIEDSVSNVTSSFTDVDAAITAGDLTALSAANLVLANQVSALESGTIDLQSATASLNSGLTTLSGKPLRGGIGFGAAFAIPSKAFSVAISANNSTSFSGHLDVSSNDLDTLTNYTNALAAYSSELEGYAQASSDATATLAAIDAEIAGDNNSDTLNALGDDLDDNQQALTLAKDNLDAFNYGGTSTPGVDDGEQVIFTGGDLDPNADTVTLASEINIIAIAISEVALSVSREFTIANRQVAIGITPKLQRVDAYHYVVNVEDETETDDIDQFGVEDNGFNLDIGASTKFGAQEQGTFGIVIKNLIGRDITTQRNGPNATIIDGIDITIAPQVRAGVAYEAFGWVHLAADLDITENDPVAFEDPTQFASLGAEADIFGTIQLRTGFRTNLASSGQDVVSGGLGLSPFGLFHIDLGVYANIDDPEKEAGLVFELGLDW
jgi:hypothetical protein